MTDCKLIQLTKANLSTFVTVLGISIDVNPQAAKASAPIVAMLLCIFIDVKLLQPAKVPPLIEVTLSGSVIDVKLLHS